MRNSIHARNGRRCHVTFGISQEQCDKQIIRPICAVNVGARRKWRGRDAIVHGLDTPSKKSNTSWRTRDHALNFKIRLANFPSVFCSSATNLLFTRDGSSINTYKLNGIETSSHC